MAGKVYYSFR